MLRIILGMKRNSSLYSSKKFEDACNVHIHLWLLNARHFFSGVQVRIKSILNTQLHVGNPKNLGQISGIWAILSPRQELPLDNAQGCDIITPCCVPWYPLLACDGPPCPTTRGCPLTHCKEKINHKSRRK